MQFPDVTDSAHEAQMARFAAAAFSEDGPAQIAFHEVSSPIGRLLVAVTHDGLVLIGFETEDREAALQRLATRISPAIVDLESAVAGVREQLDAYFTRSLRRFDLPIDRRLFTPYQHKVLTATERIPAGECRTYGQVAALAGNPKAAQATGRALGANPIPVVIPCHRVVAADGSLHGYAGGLERKQFLLDLERGADRLL